jgi:hypothetical protein
MSLTDLKASVVLGCWVPKRRPRHHTCSEIHVYMQAQLDAALKVEDYQLAARIRDTIQQKVSTTRIQRCPECLALGPTLHIFLQLDRQL